MRINALLICLFLNLAPIVAYSAVGNPLTFELDAMTGNPEAQYAAGMAYLERNSFGDAKHAIDWFAKAAKQGHADSQYELGYMFENGVAVRRDENEAAQWYKRAAEQGHMQAVVSLAEVNIKLKKEKEAFQWYRKAAEKGHATAQYILGAAYAKGIAVLIDYTEAFNWLEKANKQGNVPSKCYLAELYVMGKGVKKDLVMARKLAREGYELEEEYCKIIWEKYDLGNQ